MGGRRRPTFEKDSDYSIVIMIVDWAELPYIPRGEPLDQTGTIGHLYYRRFAVTRMGSENLSNGSSTGADSRKI